MIKIRLDQYLLQQYPHYSRRQIQSWIMQGFVFHNGKKLDKPGAQVPENIKLDCRFSEPKYVGRAGQKLEKALSLWSIKVKDKVCLDAGISVGGFTDCLLQASAKKVFGVDVGVGLVHHKIKTDPRVVLLENTNLRYLTTDVLKEQVDLISLDVSFISLLKVMDAVILLLKPGGELITLIKPQFESTKDQIEKGGLITNPAVHEEVIQKVTEGIKEYNFELQGVTESPILGATGNKEFLAYFIKR